MQFPKEGSLTSVEEYERVTRAFGLPMKPVRPDWMDFEYIDRCWRVDEVLYDPNRLRALIKERMKHANVLFVQREFAEEESNDWDFVVWATYGLHKSRRLLPHIRKQVAEKILIELPGHLRHIALVVVDGPFTGFDPYGSNEQSLFGSARFTNRWSTANQLEEIPETYREVLHGADFLPFTDTNFDLMVEDCCQAVPSARDAKYLGSRFTIRVVEDNPEKDQRILYVRRIDEKQVHIFSGKVVGAVKAARAVADLVGDV